MGDAKRKIQNVWLGMKFKLNIHLFETKTYLTMVNLLLVTLNPFLIQVINLVSKTALFAGLDDFTISNFLKDTKKTLADFSP